MFKEALITVFFFVILFGILRTMLRKNRRAFQKSVILLLLAVLLANTCYNLKNLFPDFILDGTIPLGDCRENLFLYKSDSEYSCEILFPVLKDRTILVDDSSDFYNLFLNTFSDNTEALSISLTEKSRITALTEHFSYSSILHLVTLMDYAFPDNHLLEELPMLFVWTDSLSDEDTLVAVIDDNLNLYLLSESCFLELTDGVIAEGGAS